MIIASGDTAGWIVPCGCASNQSGGLPRRATYVAGVKKTTDVLLIDVGGAALGASPYDRAKFEAILRGEALMGVAAHNIGASEARLGSDFLRQIFEETRVPRLSANARDSEGRLIAEPIRIVEAGGRRIAIVGVLSERFATANVRIVPPRPAIIETLQAAAGTYDTSIVLAYLPEDELQQLAEELPEVDAILGGPTGQPISPRRSEATILASATNKGKFLARIDVPPSGSAEAWKGSIIELRDDLADAPEQVANLAAFRQVLAARDFAPRQTAVAERWPSQWPDGFAVTGTATCRNCHKEDDRSWRHSKHAEAWKSLEKKGAHVDPDCQRCHTTAYGLPGGFASIREAGQLGNVGCESCHGPSQAHVLKPSQRTAYFARAKDHCLDCHDRENSAKFTYEEYWEAIRHGKLE